MKNVLEWLGFIIVILLLLSLWFVPGCTMTVGKVDREITSPATGRVYKASSNGFTWHVGEFEAEDGSGLAVHVGGVTDGFPRVLTQRPAAAATTRPAAALP